MLPLNVAARAKFLKTSLVIQVDVEELLCFNGPMNYPPYVDIHTHRPSLLENALSIQSVSVDELILMEGQSAAALVTAGIHPWWLEDYTESELENFKQKIQQLLEQKVLWGVGECGVDRTMPDLVDKQMELFKWHAQLAEEYELPLMIHQVRSGSDMLGMVKSLRPKVPWIFHDFRGNKQLASDLLRLHPQSYFSFGLSLDNSPQVRELIIQLPLDHLFLETDNQKHLDIHDLYLRASHYLGVNLEFLKSQLWMNFKRVSLQRI